MPGSRCDIAQATSRLGRALDAFPDNRRLLPSTEGPVFQGNKIMEAFMRVTVYALIVMGTLLCLSLGYSQDDASRLHHEELGKHQRPPARFNHDQHIDLIHCDRCHHEYDENGNNVGGDEGRACSDCHSVLATAENPIPLVKAFHIQCKTCHGNLLAKGERSGPVMCGQCHVRSPDASK